MSGEGIRAAYHNRKSAGSAGETSGSDGLKEFLTRGRGDPITLETPEALELLARKIRLQVLSLLSKADDELNTSVGFADLRMDSLVLLRCVCCGNRQPVISVCR